MSGDTQVSNNSKNPQNRASETSGGSKTPSQIYETFNTSPPSANSLPEGSGQNTAGAIGRQEVPSLFEAIQTIRWQDFKQVHMYPCTKDSLLVGIGGAFGMGGIRAIFGAPIPKAANWAVGTFAITSIAYYEFCQAKRSLEKTQMKKIVEVMDLKKAEKAAKEAALEAKRQERRRLKEEEDAKKELAASRWGRWKFW